MESHRCEVEKHGPGRSVGRRLPRRRKPFQPQARGKGLKEAHMNRRTLYLFLAIVALAFVSCTPPTDPSSSNTTVNQNVNVNVGGQPQGCARRARAHLRAGRSL